MYLVAIAWGYVALMMAAAEATSPQGTLFGAFVTLMLYGVLPLGLLMYILGTPGRKRRRRDADLAVQSDASDHAPAGAAEGLAAKREEA
jgi:hypothetical protein